LAGPSFGELALVDGRTRSARVVAIEPTMCHVVSTDAFADLLATEPASYAHLTPGDRAEPLGPAA